jgi:hypothetical protein
MTRTGRLFIAGLWALGLLSGLVITRFPDLIPLPTPYFSVPLIAALLVDLLMRSRIEAGQVDPITMNERAVAVIGASLIGLGAAALVGA